MVVPLLFRKGVKELVISDVNQVIYNGDGITTAWPYTFRIIEATDIQLVVKNANGSETKITSDYYVDVNNSTVYYPGYAPGSAPPQADQPPVLVAGQKIIVYRALPVTQEADLGEKWPFEVIENALDKLTMLIQDWRDILNRCLKVRVSDTNFDATITPVAGRAIQVTANGKGFECVESPTSVLAQCVTARDTAVASATSAANSASAANTYKNQASNAAASAVQANDSAQGALVDADALLNATRAYISAATVDGYWDSATTYEAGDVVMVTDGSVYRCIQDNTNKPPVTNPNYWAQMSTTELLTFEIDHNGDLMPLINPSASQNWDIDENDDIMPASLTTLTTVDNQEF